MDFNTALYSHSDRAPTPAPVILARNIQRFFKEKSEQLKGGGSNPQHPSNGKNGKNHHSDLDVDTVLQDVESILDGRSLEDGHLLLRGMVADLLREVDLMRWRLDETSSSLQRIREERDVVNNDYRDCLLSLILALQQAVGDDLAPNRSLLQSGQLLTADEATTMTITTLTGKIEKLNMETSEKEAELATARSRIEDLEAENAAKIDKIAALEKQFKSINKKRNKVVDSKIKKPQHSLSDTTNKHCPPSAPFDAGDVSAIKKVPINASWNSSTVSTIKIPINSFWSTNAVPCKPEIKDTGLSEPIVVEIEESTLDVDISIGTTTSLVKHDNKDIGKTKPTTTTNIKNTSINNSTTSKPKRRGHGSRLVKLVDEL